MIVAQYFYNTLEAIMRLIDVTRDNWEKVILLTTNQDGSHTLEEGYVASNAYSILQSIYESGWTIKAIQSDGILIGFTMYGLCEERNLYELCRFMIDRRYQGNGYGKKALKIIVEEMTEQFSCSEIYLSVEPENERGKYIYEKFGFIKTGEIWEDEEVYCLKL